MTTATGAYSTFLSHCAFSELGTDEKYQHVTLFLRALLNLNLPRANLILTKQSVLLLRDMGYAYTTAASVNEECFVTDLADVWEKLMQTKDETLALSFLDYFCINLLKETSTILEHFSGSMRALKGCRTP